MRPAKTLALLLILGLLSWFIFEKELPREVAKETNASLLKGKSNAQIELLRISGKVGSFSLKNLSTGQNADAVFDGKWEIEGLPGTELDKGKVNSLLTAIEQFKRGDLIPAADLEKDLSVYGLEKPELALSLKFPAEELNLDFGRKNSYLSKRYLRVSDSSDVFMSGEELFKAAALERDQFRDSSPLDLSEFDLSELMLDGPDGHLLLVRGLDKAWGLREPYAARGSATAVGEYMRSLRALSAVSYIDDTSKTAEYGLNQPVLKVTAKFSEESKKSALDIRLGRKAGDAEAMYLFVSGKPSIYQLKGNPLSGLQRAAEWFREKRLLQFSKDRISEFVISQGDERLSLIKTAGEWRVNDKAADGNQVSAYLEKLSELEASGFPAGSGSFGFDRPGLKVVLKSKQQDNAVQEQVLTIGSGTSGNDAGHGEHYAAVGNISETFIISDESLQGIKSAESAFLRKEALPVGTAPAEK